MPRCASCGRRASGAHGNCPVPDPRAGPAVAAPRVPGYVVGALLGHGGFADVWAAADPSGNPVALKVAEAGAASDRLLREERAMREVGAPPAPRVFASGRLDDGRGWLAMERIDPPTLAERLDAAGGQMPRDEAAAIASAVLDALAAVHARGFAHLDLKPENVFVGPNGARLIDFGLARRIGDAPQKPAAGFEGTAEYMSPEQCEERGDLDARADVYAAGVIVYELLAGRPPFVGAEKEVHAAHAAVRPPRPSSFAPVPESVERVVLRALAKERPRRFQSAAQLKSALSDAFARVTAPRTSVAAAPPQPGAGTRLERRPVGVLLFGSGADPGSVQTAVRGVGGELVHAARARYAAIFTGEAGQDPVRRAFRAAQALVESKIAVRAVVDVAQITAQRRADGQLRWLAPELAQEDRYPRDSDPKGPLATSAAADALAEIAWDPVRTGLVRSRAGSGGAVSAATVVQLGAGPLVGRDDVLRSLVARASDACRTANPCVATVIADPGHGKTHLAAALAQEIRQKLPEAELLDLRAREPVAGDADETLRALILRCIDAPPESTGDSVRARLLSTLGPVGAELWPAAALALRLVAPDDPSVRSLSAAPGVLRSLSARAAGEALRSRARRRAVCLLLDDAQFADDAALDAIEYATLSESRAALFVCALARPSFAEARRGFGERAARRDEHRLGPLEAGRAADLCRRLLAPAENVPAAAIEKLVQRTHGVPLLLVELVRGLKRDGIVRRRARGDTWFVATDELDALPDSPLVEWLAERELGALPPELGAHARLASLLGAEFGVEEIEGVVAELDAEGAGGEFPLDAQVATRRLMSIGLLLATRTGAYRFRHALVQDAVARSLPPAVRKKIHAAAARFYRSTRALPEVRRLPLLARHAAAAGQQAEAASLFLALARAARARHAYLDAEQSYTTALHLLDQSDLSGRLLAQSGRGSMRYRLGRYEDAVNDLATARGLAREAGDRAAEIEMLLEEATARDWTSDYVGAAELVEDAERLARDPGVRTPHLEARLTLGRARSLWRSGHRAEACAAFEEAARLAEAIGDDAYETLIVALVVLEVLLPDFGRLDDAERVCARAVELARSRGDRLHHIAALNNRRIVLVARKDVRAAADNLLAMMTLGREMGFVLAEYFGEFNLTELLYYAGDIDAAAAHALRAVQIEERHPEVASHPMALLALARIEAYRGRQAEARAVLARIEAHVRKAREEGRASAALTVDEEVLYAMVDLATRDASPAEWDALVERSARESVEQEPIEVAEMRGVCALRRGRLEEARAAFAEAASRARTIPHVMDERLRKGLAAAGLSAT